MSPMNSLNYCPGCGTKIIPDANFCMECGYNIGKLRQILNKEDNHTNFSEKNKSTDNLKTYADDKLNNHQEINNEDVITLDVGANENKTLTDDENIQTDAVNDIELVRPDYNDNNKDRQNSLHDENQLENQSIQIELSENNDFNDFDIVRPNTQKNVKKVSKDFSLLKKNKEN